MGHRQKLLRGKNTGQEELLGEHDRQRTYNVTLRRVRVTILAVGSSKYYVL
jgi:hypothetical protein